MASRRDGGSSLSMETRKKRQPPIAPASVYAFRQGREIESHAKLEAEKS
jgi:hypothetical protein